MNKRYNIFFISTSKTSKDQINFSRVKKKHIKRDIQIKIEVS